MSAAEHSASRKVIESSEPQSLDAGTEYVVLVQKTAAQDMSEARAKRTWEGIDSLTARSADAAIREAVGKLPESERKGTFVAISARSFKPVTVSEKVERTLVIGA